MFLLSAALVLTGCPRDDRSASKGVAKKKQRSTTTTTVDVPPGGPLAQKVLYEQAKQLLKAGRAEPAAEIFQRAIEAHSKDSSLLANCYLGLGSASGDLGRHDQAVEAFKKVVKLRPGDADARRALAYGLEDAGKLPQASEAFGQAVVLAPENLAIYQDLATLQLKVDDKTAAEQTYQRYEKRRVELLKVVADGTTKRERRLDVLLLLADARDEKTAGALVKLLDRTKGDVRLGVIEALGRQGLPLANAPLRTLLARTKEPTVRAAIERSLVATSGPTSQPSASGRAP